jgi:hypothetical protein
MKNHWLAALLASPALALAQEAQPKVWVNPGFFSHHFRNGDFRQDNYGPGIEITVPTGHALLAGSFINSDRERSRYAGFYWRPWRWQYGDWEFGAGAVFALVDGYSTVNAGDWFPAALPVVSAEYGTVGANLAFIPHPKNGAAIALQLKLRVW